MARSLLWRWLALVSCISLISLVGLSVFPIQAVVLRPGGRSSPVRPPPDDPGFAHVATVGGLSAVYLGSGWMLTAAHAASAEAPVFVIEGEAHLAVAGSRLELTTRAGTPADLVLFRLEDPPALPRLRIARLPAQRDEIVTMVGNGWTPGSTEVSWNKSWEQTVPALAVYRGLVREGPGVLRWGRNAVTWTDRRVVVGAAETRSFQVRFDSTGGPEQECTAVVGDSGGAAFAKRGGRWELLGILVARRGHAGQPSHVVSYGNVTEIADLSFYRDQILDITRARTFARMMIAALALALAALVATAVVAQRRRGERPRVAVG